GRGVEGECLQAEVVDPLIVVCATCAGPEQGPTGPDTRIIRYLRLDDVSVVVDGCQTRRVDRHGRIHKLALAQEAPIAQVVLGDVRAGQECAPPLELDARLAWIQRRAVVECIDRDDETRASALLAAVAGISHNIFSEAEAVSVGTSRSVAEVGLPTDLEAFISLNWRRDGRGTVSAVDRRRQLQNVILNDGNRSSSQNHSSRARVEVVRVGCWNAHDAVR